MKRKEITFKLTEEEIDDLFLLIHNGMIRTQDNFLEQRRSLIKKESISYIEKITLFSSEIMTFLEKTGGSLFIDDGLSETEEKNRTDFSTNISFFHKRLNERIDNNKLKVIFDLREEKKK